MNRQNEDQYIPRAAPLQSEGAPLIERRVRKMLPRSTAPSLHIVSKRARVEIPLSDIRFIEVYDWKCIVHCATGVCHETNMPLKDIQNQLPKKQFIRCNRSYVINLDHVISIESDCLITDSGDRVPISIRSRQAVRHLCADYLWRKSSNPSR